MNIKKRIEEALTEGAETLDPAERHVRVVLQVTVAEQSGPVAKPKSRKRTPKSAEVTPTPRELGREHRGY